MAEMTTTIRRYLPPLILGLVAACSSGENPDASGEGASATPDTSVPEAETPERRGGAAPDYEAAPALAPRVKTDDDSSSASKSRSLAQNANDLISELQDLNWDAGSVQNPLTAEILRNLRAQGADALVPIRDFLLDNQGSGDAPAELRQALLDVLLSLGVPEVEDVALELLAAAPSAGEVWRLGDWLNTSRPGKHTAAVRVAAELALIEADSAGVLPPEIFELLGRVGNVNTAVVLAEAPRRHQAYASLALAKIEDDSGLPVLEQHARQFETGRDTIQGRLALQLLAQRAPSSPSAAAALIDLAQQGVIPHDLWPYLLDIVAGNWELSLFEPPSGYLVGSHTYYSPEGDQVIYRTIPPPGAGDAMQSERLYLLDRLQPLAPAELIQEPEP